jgi:hypothetical protein
VNRRVFFGALAALPFVGKLVKPTASASPFHGLDRSVSSAGVDFLRKFYSPQAFPLAGDQRFYGGMRLLVVGTNPVGSMTMQVSKDDKTWSPVGPVG